MPHGPSKSTLSAPYLPPLTTPLIHAWQEFRSKLSNTSSNIMVSGSWNTSSTTPEAGPSKPSSSTNMQRNTQETRGWTREELYEASYPPFDRARPSVPTVTRTRPSISSTLSIERRPSGSNPFEFEPEAAADDVFQQDARDFTREEHYEASYRPMTIYGPRLEVPQRTDNDEEFTRYEGKGKARAADTDIPQNPFQHQDRADDEDEDLDITADLQRIDTLEDVDLDVTADLQRTDSFDFVYQTALQNEAAAPSPVKYTGPPVSTTAESRRSRSTWTRWSRNGPGAGEDIEMQDFNLWSRWSPSPSPSRKRGRQCFSWVLWDR